MAPPNEKQSALLETIASYDALLENLPVAVYTCDADGFIISYNQAAVNLWGRKPHKGQRWTGVLRMFDTDGNIVPPENSPMAQTLKAGAPAGSGEIIIQWPDGPVRVLSVFPRPIFNAEGKLLGGINTLLDITESKQVESNESFLAAIIASSDDAIISKNLNSIISTWNHAAEMMYGWSAAEAVGKHISLIIPEDRLDEETLIINKIRSGQRVEHFETLRKTRAGDLIPVSLTISPIKDSHGNVVGASKIARDITRLKNAEAILKSYAEKLQILNDIGAVVSGSLDVDKILQAVTDTTTKLTGADFGAFFYNKVDEKGESYMLYTLSGAPKEAFEKLGMPRNTDVFYPTFTGQGVVRVDDITKDPRYGHNPPHYGKPKGHLPVVSYLAVPVISKDGEVLGGLFYGHPEPSKFTAEHEQMLSGVAVQAGIALDNAKMYEQIKKLNAKKDEFIGMASHELRTPVTSLKGYLQIFERGLPEGDKNKAHIRKAVQQVNKLSNLIGDLLDVSKIETGKLPLTFTLFDLHLLLKEVVELMQYSARGHTLNLQTEAGEVMVNADRQRIEQVVINLVSNAIKYSPNAVKIFIRLSVANNSARVEVQDFGIGIAKDQLPRIFSRFYRVDESVSHISGLGIGLYISREIIQRHKGQLSATSEPGAGSTFWFEIPL